MLEFKLQCYFEIYKDAPILKSSKFKEDFIKKHGNFELLSELVVMIQRYQRKKYGDLLNDGTNTIEKYTKGTRNRREISRKRNKLGTKEERNKRKSDYDERNLWVNIT